MAGVLVLGLVAALVAVGRGTARDGPPSAASVTGSGNGAATTAAPETTTTSAAPSVSRDDLRAYAGPGTWVDAFDFSPAHSNGKPEVAPADVDRMVAAGVRTIYIQSARPEDPLAPGDLLEPGLLGQFLARAHARGLNVVAWYLPHLSNLDDDMRHVTASMSFSSDGHRFDGFALDSEWRAAGPDHGALSAQLVELSRRIRDAAGERPVGAIVMPPVLTDVVNPAFWPGFPWAGIAPYYDVWLPMGYWTNRTTASGFRDAARYTAENVRLLRAYVGDVAIHAIGGIGDAATADDYEGFARVCAGEGLLGCSVYDWETSGAAPLAVLRR